MGNDVVFATTVAALWFWIGWRIRGEREIRRQGEVLRSMMDILQAQTTHSDGAADG